MGRDVNVTDEQVEQIMAGLAQIAEFAYNKSVIEKTETGYSLALDVDILADHLSEEDERTLYEAVPELFTFNKVVESNVPALQEGAEEEDDEEEDTFMFLNLGFSFDAALNFVNEHFSEFTTELVFDGTSHEDEKWLFPNAANTGSVEVKGENVQSNYVKLVNTVRYSNELSIVNPIGEEMVAGEDYFDLSEMGMLLDMVIQKLMSEGLPAPESVK